MNDAANIKSSLLLIYTGGTIGMKLDHESQTLKPFDFGQIMMEVPEMKKYAIKIDSCTLSPVIDSSDVSPVLWQTIAGLIREHYPYYDGFIILHGTDTMAYSASALSFMIDGNTKPVIFTGSQLPIGAARTDGKENLMLAAEIASAKDEEGHAMVPEVCVCFGSLLMRGNRTTKVNADVFRAFATPNFPPLAEGGINIRYNTEVIRRPQDWYQSVSINTALDTRVGILKLHPGMTQSIVRHILCGNETRAVIIETYGSGNAPSAEWFHEAVREAIGMGKILVNATQCLTGTVDMGIYANGKQLETAGVINGYDGTTESLLGKLFFLMGRSDDNRWVKKMMQKNLRGEISK